jgi:hypothetical protein
MLSLALQDGWNAAIDLLVRSLDTRRLQKFHRRHDIVHKCRRNLDVEIQETKSPCRIARQGKSILLVHQSTIAKHQDSN